MLLKHPIYLYLFILTYYSQTVQAQDNNNPLVFLDKRDNTEYPLVEINGKAWFAIDLKYISTNAYFQDMDSLQTIGNFYYRDESLEVCPEGWELSGKEDWIIFTMNLFNQITANSNDGIDLCEHLGFAYPHLFSAGILPPLNFWGTGTLLNIAPTGRIENGVFYTPNRSNYANYWTTGPDEKHPYYHIHIDPNVIAGHSHKHHISPRAKKKRMFKVRCVQVINNKK
jgi:uncharacterized protein (TIGR02145 family)